MKDPGYVEIFNSIAGVYDKRYGKSCKYAQDLIFKYTKNSNLKPEVILDIGCGTGALLDAATKVWSNSVLVGIDPAIKMINVARERIPTASLFVNHAEDIPLQDSSVDLIVSTTSFAHWSNQLLGLLEIRRVLSPMGSCIIVEHFKPNFLTRLSLLIINRLANFPESKDLEKMITNVGFELIHLKKIKSYLLVHFKHKLS
uniref:RenJ n=1 Tax=Candidatus Endohaliclona renieramycinifaciens TaxID=2565582 RepID=A0A4D6G3G9_9GAMM|nr:RenJ [Candidatus Endohaliclona renieramycinifaciens]QCC21401.1 RenJ [Candidatus Endohaliclona renieramycinifaciens]QCC21417.1 RenJ [Candidatus Endohaliclona renieramycinifaciens]QCC21433.1 RenJ [Candidatus Endohaliclona renieramycinifaciens]